MKEIITKKEILIALIAAVLFTAVVTYLISPSSAFIQNSFWTNITYMGDAVFAFGITFFLLFFLDLKKLSLRLILSLAITLIIVQFTKNLLSGETVHLYFEAATAEPLFLHPSVISSHTAIAFTMAVFFTYYFRSILLSIVLFIAAFSVAASRMVIGGENIFSLATGVVPAIISVLLISRVSFKNPRTKMYRNRERRVQHTTNLMPY